MKHTLTVTLANFLSRNPVGLPVVQHADKD
jgi:hypothetical protein